MIARRVWLCATLVAVGALAVWFAVANWDVANRIASVISALAGVAAVGIAIWAALPTSRRNKMSVRVSHTGDATSTSGTANSGVIGRANADIRVDRTGDADAADGGSANTGFSGTA